MFLYQNNDVQKDSTMTQLNLFLPFKGHKHLSKCLVMLARFLSLNEVLVSFYTAINKILSVFLFLFYVTLMLDFLSKVNFMTFFDTQIEKHKLQNVVCVIIFIETSLQNATKSNSSNVINTENNIFKHQY